MAFSWLPLVGNVLDSAFKLGSTKSQVGGLTQAASQVEKYNREAQERAAGLQNQGRTDIQGYNSQGRGDITEANQRALRFLEPYAASGNTTLDMLVNQLKSGPLGQGFNPQDLQNDPGYQFRLNQGLQGVQQTAAGRGMLQSGGALKALERYGQGFASNEFQNAFNRDAATKERLFSQLFGVSGLGANAAQQQAALTSQAGSQLANNAQRTGEELLGQAIPLSALMGQYSNNIGDAQANARLGRGNAYGTFYNSAGGNAQNILNSMWPKRRTEQLSF